MEARPFEFLNLGLLAYLGGGEALSQFQVRRMHALPGSGGRMHLHARFPVPGRASTPPPTAPSRALAQVGEQRLLSEAERLLLSVTVGYRV